MARRLYLYVLSFLGMSNMSEVPDPAPIPTPTPSPTPTPTPTPKPKKT